MNRIKQEQITLGSSAICSLTYSVDCKELSVLFISGQTYTYKNVDYDTYIGMKYSDSIGKYFNRVIKDNYDYEITPEYI